MGGPIHMEKREMSQIWCWTHYAASQPWLDIEFLDFQGQISLYFRNGWTNGYETKDIWIDRMMVILLDLPKIMTLDFQG